MLIFQHLAYASKQMRGKIPLCSGKVMSANFKAVVIG
jgi:hypothetical protein